MIRKIVICSVLVINASVALAQEKVNIFPPITKYYIPEDYKANNNNNRERYVALKTNFQNNKDNFRK